MSTEIKERLSGILALSGHVNLRRELKRALDLLSDNAQHKLAIAYINHMLSQLNVPKDIVDQLSSTTSVVEQFQLGHIEISEAEKSRGQLYTLWNSSSASQDAVAACAFEAVNRLTMHLCQDALAKSGLIFPQKYRTKAFDVASQASLTIGRQAYLAAFQPGSNDAEDQARIASNIASQRETTWQIGQLIGYL